MKEDQATREIINAAMHVHSALGPGLLEEPYKQCLVYELRKRGLIAEKEVLLPVYYDDIKVNCGYRLDILVENSVIVELKSVLEISQIHRVQLLTYLKLSKLRVGLILNFNVIHLREGISRMML